MLHARDEASLVAALCLIFKLSRSEGQMLVQLLAHDYSTKEELRVAAQTITHSSTHVLLNSLRAKLKVHGIEVANINGLGYGLNTSSRAKINRGIAKYDAESLPARPEPDLTPDANVTLEDRA
jgi:hypothetical protein